jgi:hypothetical protein
MKEYCPMMQKAGTKTTSASAEKSREREHVSERVRGVQVTPPGNASAQ